MTFDLTAENAETAEKRMQKVPEDTNLWCRLPTGCPFVLPGDRDAVIFYNKEHAADDKKSPRYIHTELIPEPFVGNPGAPVVLLNLNPGFSADDAPAHIEPAFNRALRLNLEHKKLEYPFYYLNPAFSAPGCGWWQRILGPLLKCLNREGVSTQEVSRQIFCIEYFGYHTKKFAHGGLQLDSQKYGFSLVCLALDRGAFVVVMRKADCWEVAVPTLRSYGRRFDLLNHQMPWISPGNCPDGFSEIVTTIKNAAKHGSS